MDKILIVDEDQSLLESIKNSLDKMHQFEVITVAEYHNAVELLSQKRISVLVTVIDSPTIDGLELVAYMTKNKPLTPIVIMTEYGKPWFYKHVPQNDFLYHIEKPFEVRSLASAILVGLSLRDEGKNINGVAMANLLPIIEAQRKSCRMEVKSADKEKGYLYFDDGELIDASFKNLNGKKAAMEMVKWERVAIKFSDLPRRRRKNRIKTSLMDIVGATWLKADLKADEGIALKKEAKASHQDKILAKTFAQVLDRHIQEFRSINGYMAVGILNDKREVLSHDTANEAINFSQIVASFDGLFTTSTGSAAQTRLNKCLAFTFHTKKCIVLTLSVEIVSVDNFHLVGLTAPSGNWFFMQRKMEKIRKIILENIG